MKNRVIIVHGWDGHPNDGWFPWLKHELETRGIDVIIPQLPFPEEPRIARWVSALSGVVGDPDERTFFVGHSLGCQAIVRYLEGLSGNQIVGGAVFVAGYFTQLTNLEDDDVVRSVADEWMKTPVDLRVARTHLVQSVAIFSDNDRYVPLDNVSAFQNELGSTIVIEHERGHFFGDDGVTELPSARDAILRHIKSS